jgi:NADPH2:quinone reductase
VPFTPGEDIVGVVDKLGEGVSTVEPGQKLVPVPSGLDHAEAVCLGVNYLTAHLALHRTANVQSGERILVHGAAGGVGTALLQLGKLAGLEMYGTASKHNHQLVSALGATPIDYRTEDFVERIRSLTGDGVDAVFDLIGGAKQLWRSHRALRKGGRLLLLGSVATSKGGMRAIPLTMLMLVLIKLIPDGRRAPLSVSSHAQRLVPRNADGAPRFGGSGQDQAGGGGAHSVG